MVRAKKIGIVIYIGLVFTACNEIKKEDVEIEKLKKETKISTAEIKQSLTEKGFQIFDYVDEKTKDTVLMQEYFIAFLKKGPNRSQSQAEADSLQKLHLAHSRKSKCMNWGLQIYLVHLATMVIFEELLYIMCLL